jgi:MucB/RseB N-terminal domain
VSHLHDKVSGLVDGELAGVARTRALNHLRRCEDCRAEIRATLAVKRRLGDLAAAEPPADLRSALGSLPSPALAAAPEPMRSQATRRLLVGAVSMSVALLTVAYAVGSPDEPDVATVTPPVDRYTADFAATSGASPLADPAMGAIAPNGSTLNLMAVGQLVGPVIARIAGSRPAGDDDRAVAALERASAAGQDLAYTGVRRVAVFEGIGPSLVTVRIEHAPGQGTSFDVKGHGNDAATFIAAHEAAQTERVSKGPLSMLINAFDIAIGGRGTIAQRPTTVVTASSDGRLAARFWVDDETGLLLRRDLYDEGRPVRTSQFTTIDLSRRTFFAHLPPELGVEQGTALRMTFAPSLTDQGLACPKGLPGGFRLIGLQRLPDDTVQATYSDGLSTVAIYEQRGHLDPSGLRGFDEESVAGQPVYVLDGLPRVAVWESAGTVYSVVSDAPDAVTADALAGLPHDVTDEPGTTDRIATGLRRLGALANPAD